MILDNNLVLADTVIVTTAAASTDYIDTLADGDANVGAWFVVKTESTAFTAGAGAPAVNFQLQTSDNTDFLADGVTLAQSGSLLAADLTADKIVYAVRIPSGVQRYIRGYYYISNYAANTVYFSACSYSMFIVLDKDMNSLVAQS